MNVGKSVKMNEIGDPGGMMLVLIGAVVIAAIFAVYIYYSKKQQALAGGHRPHIQRQVHTPNVDEPAKLRNVFMKYFQAPPIYLVQL